MSGRSRRGLHVVREGLAPLKEPTDPLLTSGHRPLTLGLHQQSVALGIAGTLNADTAGRLRLFLSMFTVDGGPRELVLDLSDVLAVDEDGMAPIFEADEAMCSRTASMRLSSMSAAVARYLVDVRLDGMLATGRPPEPDDAPELPARDDDPPRRGED
jgi:anti-anti-sigma regulatory factor